MMNLKKHVSHMSCKNKFIFGKIRSFLYVLDIDVTRNGNNLKLKVKSELSLVWALMLNNHSNPYIHSTTVLCDNNILWYRSTVSL